MASSVSSAASDVRRSVEYGVRDTARAVEQGAREAAGELASSAADLADRAGRHLEGALSSAEATARQVAESGREAGERVNQVAGNMKTAIDKSLKEQPLTTLAMAVVAGFVVGALWKS